MQKKLLGMAVAAALAAPALALAQSSVQVYGTVHLSVNQTKFGDGDATTAPTVKGTTKYGVSSHASNWGLRSTESLGGGMSAWFQAEFNMQMERRNDTNTGVGSARNSGVGLRGNFGNIYLGTWETPWAQTFRMWDVGTIGGWGPTTSIMGRRETTGRGVSRNCSTVPGGTLTPGGALTAAAGGLPACSGTTAAVAAAPLGYPLWRRFAASMFYESPIFSGVQAKLAIQPNSTRASNLQATDVPAGTTIQENPSAWSGSLAWTGMGGRARAFIANMRAKDFTAVGSTDSGYTFGGGYDFGAANVGASYEKYTYKTGAGDLDARQWGVGVAVPVGSGKIGASYAKARQLAGAAAVGRNDTQAKMWNIGYEWSLSKRTALGFGIAKIKNGGDQAFTWTGQTPGTNGGVESVGLGQDQTNLFVSMRHSF